MLRNQRCAGKMMCNCCLQEERCGGLQCSPPQPQHPPHLSSIMTSAAMTSAASRDQAAPLCFAAGLCSTSV